MPEINDNKPAIPAGPNPPEKVKEVNKEHQQKSDPQITELNNFFRDQDDLEPKDKNDNEDRNKDDRK